MSPVLNQAVLEGALVRELTQRQFEVLETAFEAGYYEWPRESTGGKIAEALDVTSARCSEHVYSAERKLLSMVFGRPSRDAGE